MKPYLKYIPWILLAVLAFLYWFKTRESNDDAIDMQKYILKEEANRKIQERDSIIASLSNNINALIDENRKAQSQSSYWYKVAQERSKSPDYNIDFITASSIITNSSYRPTE